MKSKSKKKKINVARIIGYAFIVFFSLSLFAGFNALFEGRFVFGLFAIIGSVALMIFTLSKIFNQDGGEKTKAKIKSKTKPLPEPKKTQIGVAGFIYLILLFIFCFVIANYSYHAWKWADKQQSLNCKMCSWTEWHNESCKYTQEELMEQEHGNNPWCRDMGNYEMIWKLSAMGFMTFTAMGLFTLVLFLYEIVQLFRRSL